MKIRAVSLIAILRAAGLAQHGAEGPKFEVASIKASPLPREATHIGTRIEGSTVDIGLAPLTNLIATAYKVERYQVSGPDWMLRERFDILAKMPEGANKDQVPQMLEALLAERFHMVAHRESREESVFALVVGKGGAKLKDSPPDAGASGVPFPDGANGRVLVEVQRTPNGIWTTSKWNGQTVFEAEKISLPELALQLMRYLDRPVIDMTELKGTYRVALNVPYPSGLQRPIAARAETAQDASDPGGGSILKSVEALGLRLEKRNAPIERIVVERIDKTPTEN